LIARILNDEVEATCYPLGNKNKLIIANGLMAGIPVSSVNRVSIGAKSPLTGGIKESNAGGVAAFKMKHMDLRAIVLEGKPSSDHWFVIRINRTGVYFELANDLQNTGIHNTTKKLLERYGSNNGLILIGPAGEKGYAIAGIATTDKDGVFLVVLMLEGFRSGNGFQESRSYRI